MAPKLRLGRIRYINVLPIYYGLEQALLPNGFEMVLGTPAELNAYLYTGQVDVSAISSLEYGRHFREYLLLPDLSISTQGDVGSVLFFSRLPFHCLTGQEVRLSNSSATSAALVKVILAELYGVQPHYHWGPVTDEFATGCAGLLAIGDEALRLRAAGNYPYFMDLGQAWYRLTRLPFVFGVWAVRRAYFAQQPARVSDLHQTLLHSKQLGLKALEEISGRAATEVHLTVEQLVSYFKHLNYGLDDRQQNGLATFFRYLYRGGELTEMPELQFIY